MSKNLANEASDKNAQNQGLQVAYIDTSADEFELDYTKILKIIWDGRKTILYFAIAFFVLGLFHYSAGSDEFLSEAKLLQEQQPSSNLGVSALQQFGIGLTVQGTGDPSSPASITDIIENIDFQSQFIQEKVLFSNLETELTLQDYFTQYHEPPLRSKVYSTVIDYTIFLPFTLYDLIRNAIFSSTNSEPAERIEEDEDPDILVVSPQVLGLISEMEGRTNIQLEESIITTSVRLPDPMAAAQANAILINRVQEYMIENKIEKAKQNLEFVQILQLEAKDRYENAQLEVARFQDQNRGSLSATASTELERLQDEKNRTFSLYSALSQRLEEARLKLQEDTPIYTMFQKPLVPNSSSGTSTIIIPASLIFGIITGVVWIFLIRAYNAIKSNIINT